MKVEQIPVQSVRPEEGLGRKRDRHGHEELCRSIEQFGVLTPITVRRAGDHTNEYLLIKGQGRTLACRLLGIARIPAIVVEPDYADIEKVQQFLVENVARLKMRPVDRALLIAHSRSLGEETSEVAQRFGISPATVRRLEAQLDGANAGEIAALRDGHINLATHAVIARHVPADERGQAISIIVRYGIRAGEVEGLFMALNWKSLVDLGPDYGAERSALLNWCCAFLAGLPRNDVRNRLWKLAMAMPVDLPCESRVTGAR